MNNRYEQWYQVIFEGGVGFRRTTNFTDRISTQPEPEKDRSTFHSVMYGALVFAPESPVLDENGRAWIRVAENCWLPAVSDSGESLLLPIADSTTQITSNVETLVLGITVE